MASWIVADRDGRIEVKAGAGAWRARNLKRDRYKVDEQYALIRLIQTA